MTTLFTSSYFQKTSLSTIPTHGNYGMVAVRERLWLRLTMVKVRKLKYLVKVFFFPSNANMVKARERSWLWPINYACMIRISQPKHLVKVKKILRLQFIKSL